MTITRKQIRQLVEAELKQADKSKAKEKSQHTWKSIKVEDLGKMVTNGDFTLNYQGPQQIIITAHLTDANDKSKMYDLVIDVNEKTSYNIHVVK